MRAAPTQRLGVYSSADEFEIRPEPDRAPGLDFVRPGGAKQAKSRLHLDFRPDDQDARWLGRSLMAHGGGHSPRGIDLGRVG